MYACTNQTEDIAYSYTSLAIWIIKLSKHMEIFNSLHRPFGSCHVTGLSSDTSSLNQPMWRWIKNARFSGVKQFRQQKVNMWTYTVSLYHNIVPNCVSHLFLFFMLPCRIIRQALSTHWEYPEEIPTSQSFCMKCTLTTLTGEM